MRVAIALVGLLLVLAAVGAAWKVGTETGAPGAVPATSTRAQSPGPAPSDETREVEIPPSGTVGGWDIVGRAHWIPLSNNYHAATFYAINRMPRDMWPEGAFVVVAAYENMPGLFQASCEAIEVAGRRPVTREQLFAARPRARAVPPGEMVLFTCFPYVTEFPDKRVRIDESTTRIFASEARRPS